MGDIENHAKPLELREEFDPHFAERPGHAGAICIMRSTVMSRADGTKTRIPPVLGLLGPDNRVGPFHAQNDAEWQMIRSRLCKFPMVVKVAPRAEDADMALLFEQSVIRELGVSRRVGERLGRVIEISALVAGLEFLIGSATGEKRGDANPNACFAKFRERDGVSAAGPHVGHAGFPSADFVHVQSQIAIE